MRLLFVGTNSGGGGTESHFITLAKAMQAAGHPVMAVLHPHGLMRQQLRHSEVEIVTGVFRNAIDPRGIRAVWRAVRHFRPDWIIGSFSKEYWPLAVLARLCGVRLALFKHMDKPMRWATHHAIPRLADRFIVISNFMRQRFIERGIAPQRLQVLYNPLDLNDFRPDPALRVSNRAQLGYQDDDIVAGFVGALHPGKGIFVWLQALDQAMAQNPRIRALWLGQGVAAAAFKQALAASPFAERHQHLGWQADLRPYYAAMDVLALPSIESDTFGRVLIEAQACGVPVLASRIGGLPEALQDGISGHLLTPGDVGAWRDALLALSTQGRQDMAQAGRDWVQQQFGAARVAADFSQMLEGSAKEVAC